MKYTSIALVTAASFALVGCNVAGKTITIADIQAATIKACQFEPTAVELAGMIPNVSSNYIADANSIATSICSAVKSLSTTASKPPTTTSAVHRKTNAPVVANVVLPNGQVVKVTGVFVQ